MPGILTFVLGGAVLALVGWAAWSLSGGFTAHRTAPETPYQRGLNALIAGDRQEALEAFAETVKVDSDNIDAYIHLGNLLREQGDADRALHLHRELTVRSGQTATQQKAVRESLVLDWIALKRPEQAVREAADLRDLDRRNGSSLKLLLRAHEAARDWERAFEIRTEIAKQAGERGGEALALYRAAIGESLLRDGQIDAARRQFKEALRWQRNLPAALLRLGDIYYERNRPERAMVLWKGLAATHPERAHLVLERLEAAYFEKGRFSEMGRMYEEMLGRSPHDVRIHVALARMHIKKGELGEASRVLNEALEIDSHSLPARLLLVTVFRRRGELGRALDEMETLLRGLERAERFACSACGAPSDEYWTRCPSCFAWSTLA